MYFFPLSNGMANVNRLAVDRLLSWLFGCFVGYLTAQLLPNSAMIKILNEDDSCQYKIINKNSNNKALIEITANMIKRDRYKNCSVQRADRDRVTERAREVAAAERLLRQTMEFIGSCE